MKKIDGKQVSGKTLLDLRNLVKQRTKMENRAKRAIAEYKAAEARVEERVYEELLALDVEDPALWRINWETGKLERKPQETSAK